MFELKGKKVSFVGCKGSHLIFSEKYGDNTATEYHISHTFRLKTITKAITRNLYSTVVTGTSSVEESIHPLELPCLRQDVFLAEDKVMLTINGVDYLAVKSGWMKHEQT
jgi:hypothetical protein